MKKTGFALLGCGKIARKHVHVIQNYLDNAEIVGFCDVLMDRAKDFSERHSAPAFSCIKDLMDSVGDKTDIVNILTPSGIHAQNVAELVRYGKHLVVEKPIALSLNEADEIISNCDAHNVKIFVVHQNRYNLPILKAREALEKERLGINW